MYKDRKILGIVPARGGSKGIKNKNIINLDGKPLISYTIECGLKSKYLDAVIVSTDSEKIAEVSKQYGARVPFIRPADIAQDGTPTIDVVLHTIRALRGLGEEYDDMVLLQPTQPLRTTEDLDNAIEEYFKNGMETLISVSFVNDHPLLVRKINPEGKLEKLIPHNKDTRRQDMPAYYRINGCLYISQIAIMNENTSFSDFKIPFIMGQNHSVDIDEPIDLVVAEYYLRNGNK